MWIGLGDYIWIFLFFVGPIGCRPNSGFLCFFSPLVSSLRAVVKKNGLFMVRLTVRVYPLPPPLTVRVL